MATSFCMQEETESSDPVQSNNGRDLEGKEFN